MNGRDGKEDMVKKRNKGPTIGHPQRQGDPSHVQKDLRWTQDPRKSPAEK